MNLFQAKISLLVIFFGFGFVSSFGNAEKPKVGKPYQSHPIKGPLGRHAAIEAHVLPYRAALEKEMSKRLAILPREMRRGQPESSLGNLVSDMGLAYLRQKGFALDVFVTNLGGIRNDLAAGPVTLREIYEILPFENRLVIITVTGQSLRAILHRLALLGGEPVAGLSMQIGVTGLRGTARIGGKALEDKATYHLATSDYLADTGFLAPFLKNLRRTSTDFFLRDAVVWGLEQGLQAWKLGRDRRVVWQGPPAKAKKPHASKTHPPPPAKPSSRIASDATTRPSSQPTSNPRPYP